MEAASAYEYKIDAIVANIDVCGIGAVDAVAAEKGESGAVGARRCNSNQQAGSAGAVIHGETGTEGTAGIVLERGATHTGIIDPSKPWTRSALDGVVCL